MLTYIRFIVSSAMSDLLRNKLRTFLTSLGILIGVSSVVLLIAFGVGLKNFIKNQFDSLGSNLIYILPGQVLSKSGGFKGGGGAMTTTKFEERDITDLKKIKEATSVVGAFTKSVSVTAGTITEDGTLYGTTPEYFTARMTKVTFGRLFDKRDADKRTKVVVIGPKIAGKLFTEAAAAIGKTIKIDGFGYTVVGVTEAKGGGGFGGPDIDSFIYMPFKTAFVMNPDKKLLTIFIQAVDEKSIPDLKLKITQSMKKRYREDDFSVVEQTQILDTVQSIFSMLNSVLIAIGAISLIVGGVGIMNIMYVSVTERIKEIGVRRAIGATKRDILFQFLTEAVVLSLVGGLLGLLLSTLVVLIIQQFFPAQIDATSVGVSLGVSSLVGIVFGVFPAKKAADLSPIDAIRYE
jgi:putative ABC transport system permease protein